MIAVHVQVPIIIVGTVRAHVVIAGELETFSHQFEGMRCPRGEDDVVLVTAGLEVMQQPAMGASIQNNNPNN